MKIIHKNEDKSKGFLTWFPLPFLRGMQLSEDVLLFTKPGCQKCDYLKGKIPNGRDVQIMDMTTVDGMAHGAYYELIERDMPILIHNDQAFEGAIKIKNKMLDIANIGK